MLADLIHRLHEVFPFHHLQNGDNKADHKLSMQTGWYSRAGYSTQTSGLIQI